MEQYFNPVFIQYILVVYFIYGGFVPHNPYSCIALPFPPPLLITGLFSNI